MSDGRRADAALHPDNPISNRDAADSVAVDNPLTECQKCGEWYPWHLWRDHIHDALDSEREQVTNRLNGCEHEHVRLVTPTFPGGDSFWACHACGQRFSPLLTEPVRPRADSRRERLSAHQDW